VGQGLYNGKWRAFLLTPSLWTLMFYIDADNDLEATYPPIVNHLESVAGTPGVRIVALWDRQTDGDSAYYEIQPDDDPGNLALYTAGATYWPQGELDMSSRYTLSDFITWAMTNYPAQRYALTLEDHGSGLGGGLCDGTCANMMDLPDLRLALDVGLYPTGETLDVLVMNMCLMGMIEDAYQVRDYVDYYVASEHLQWVYTDYLPGLQASSTPAQMAALFASNYAVEMTAEGRAYTISVGDMAQLPALVGATDGLANALIAHMGEISGTLSSLAGDVQRFDNKAPSGITVDDTYADLHDLAGLIAVNLGGYPDIVAAAQAVTAAVEAFVIYENHASTAALNFDDSHGVSIFFPGTSSSFYDGFNNDFADGTNWGSVTGLAAAQAGLAWGPMLVDYIAQVNPNGPDDSTPPEPAARLSPFFDVFLPLISR
jgi:hypothetical protein